MVVEEIIPQPVHNPAHLMPVIHVETQHRQDGMHAQIVAIHFDDTLLFLIENQLGLYHGIRTGF